MKFGCVYGIEVHFRLGFDGSACWDWHGWT